MVFRFPQPGTYTGTITSTLGCTTTATVNLSVTPVQTGVTQLNVNLIALATGAQFQWLNCGNGFAQVAGANAATFTPTANGSYAVEVTQGGCTDTSACYAVIGIGLNEQDPLANMSVRLDADGHTLLVVGGDAMGRSTITVRDVQGRPLRTEATSISSSRFDLAELPTGPYLVQVTTAKAQRMWRVVLVR
ncbi:MAG: T9SS type A sorting domain-containing protein [Flavobacteriales bacterium]|nr:T9SS type A sorting domain-containing protein [Flavobacteriales bacterium]